MSSNLVFRARCADGVRVGRFEALVGEVQSGLAVVAEQWGAPPVRLTVVFADDFVVAVGELMVEAAAARGMPHQPFTTDRVGGQVVAKQVSLSADESRAAVVFNAALHSFADPAQQAFTTFLIAHELTHPILNRLRALGGADRQVPAIPQTAAEFARAIAGNAIDEYRCDRVADLVLGALHTVVDEGALRTMRMADLPGGGGGHLAGLAHSLDRHVHPAWPDLVQDYREHRVPLRDMWGAVITATDQTWTVLAHAQAEAEAAGLPGPVEGVCADHPAVRLYLASAWTALLGELRAHPLVPSAGEFAAVERSLLKAGERGVLQMWRTLGLTFRPGAGGEYMQVSAPLR